MQARDKIRLYEQIPGVRIDGLNYAAYMNAKRQREHPILYMKLPGLRIDGLTKQEYNRKIRMQLERAAEDAVRRYLNNPILTMRTTARPALRQRFAGAPNNTKTSKSSKAAKASKASKAARHHYHTRSKNSRTRTGTRYNRH